MATATASKQDCIQNCQECQTVLSDMLTATAWPKAAITSDKRTSN